MSIDRSMSAGQRHRTRVCVVAQDSSEVGNLVFKINLKHLFSSSSSSSSSSQPEKPQAQPEAVACFKQVDHFERMAFAASASGDVIVAANDGGCGRTLIYDPAGGVSPGPEMRSVKHRLFLVPVGDHMFFAISANSSLDVPRGGPWFEALQQQLVPGGWPTVGWAAGYINYGFIPQVSYFGGGRFCVSTTNRTIGENKRSVVSFKAVEVTAELQLIERGSSCYLMPQSSRGSPANVI